jgi:hypothetical protein
MANEDRQQTGFISMQIQNVHREHQQLEKALEVVDRRTDRCQAEIGLDDDIVQFPFH